MDILDTKAAIRGLQRLNDEIANLEVRLQPLIRNLTVLASQLPLLEKAKLFTLYVYAIDALIHSFLRLRNINVQSHPISREPKHVQQYFAKIDKAENNPPVPRNNMSVNMEATLRVLKHDLAENGRQLKQQFQEQLAKEQAKTLLRSIRSDKRLESSQDEPNLPLRVRDQTSRKRQRTAGPGASRNFDRLGLGD